MAVFSAATATGSLNVTPPTNGVVSQARRILISIFLVAAFSATGVVLLFVITADQLQRSMAAPALAKIKTSIGTIRHDVAALEDYYRVLDLAAKEQVAVEQALSIANRDIQDARAVMITSADDTERVIDQYDTTYLRSPLVLRPFARIESAVAPSSQTLVLAHAGATRDPAPVPLRALTFGSDVANYFAAYYAEVDRLPPAQRATARASLDAFRNLTYKSLGDYMSAHARYDASVHSVQFYTAQIAALERKRTQLNEVIAPKGSALANDDYWNLCEDFYSFKLIVGDWAYSIVLLPEMMLVLMLSIFMGILGSLILLSREFIRNPEGRGFWTILFRIGLGAGVAFALFFFAAAGMLALTEVSSGEAQTGMSPYLISFLGISAGYMSDRVAQWMREVGERVFKLKAGGLPPRWAVGLGPALTTLGLSRAAAASACGVSTGDVDGWAALKSAVPGNKQALIAAFLRVHPSRIFTDIAPA